MTDGPRLELDYLLHGGDYNPDQWLHDRGTLAEDLRLMELARWNAASIGVFAWAALEPADGEYRFDWLDERMEQFAARGWKVALATPSAAVPRWMTRRWPEMMRVLPDGRRRLPGERMSYCLSHPVLRERIRTINRALARRYGCHPALLLWHVSNEYVHYDETPGCFCEGCQAAFRDWLMEKYDGDLDRLNHCWWSAFWSHTFSAWEEIQAPAPHGDQSLHGLQLDWRRFVTDQTIDCFRNEIGPLREPTPETPVTTNLMGFFPGLNYWKLARELDVVTWDSYPTWHKPSSVVPNLADAEIGCETAFLHDLNRSLGGGMPFLLLESTPSVTNWQPVAKLKRPGMHRLSSLQAIAHGSDSVMYFQWRKGRGAFEKFHGAVVDHAGHENTRVFRDVAEVGSMLERLGAIAGSRTRAEAAIVFDWENRWAIDDAAGPRIENKDYVATCMAHYRPLWRMGIPVDIVPAEGDFSSYRLLIAPMLYMVSPAAAKRLKDFVRSGGALITTYWTGIVDENDLVYTGGFPGPLRELLGVWSEEIDALHPGERNRVAVEANGNGIDWRGEYNARELCDLIHAETAEVIGSYLDDFYAGRPAVTVNRYGQGCAYYIASRNDDEFTNDLLEALTRTLALSCVAPGPLPPGVTAQARYKDNKEFVFLMNFSSTPAEVQILRQPSTDILSGKAMNGRLTLPGYGVSVLEYTSQTHR